MALRLRGSDSGYVEIDAPAVAGSNSITLPATTGTINVKDASGNTEVGTGVTFGNPGANIFTINNTGGERLRIAADGTVSIPGALNVSGVLTYEDVTSVDSIGIITARQGVVIGTGASIGNPANNELKLYTNSIERINISSTGITSVTGSLAINDNYLPTAGPLSNRNLIINGAMQVAQRGTTSTSGGYQTVDRMDVQLAQGTFAQSQGTLATSDLPFTEDGHTYFVRMTNTTGSTAGGAFRGPSTILEAQDIHSSGWNYKSTSSYVTLSFWVRASVSQEFYASLVAFDGTAQNYVFSFTPEADTWTKVTKTIPGNTNLQFDLDNGPGLKISISAFWGTDWTDPSVTTDSWQSYTGSTRFPDFATTWVNTNGATFDITGLQLEVGEKATPFEHRSYGEELALCQRYFYKIGGTENKIIAPAFSPATSEVVIMVPHPVTMRIAPTDVDVVSTNNNNTDFFFRTINNTGVALTGNGRDNQYHTEYMLNIWFNGMTGMPQVPGLLRVQSGRTAHIHVSAEL